MLEWEIVVKEGDDQAGTWRLKVPGGWLVCTVINNGFSQPNTVAQTFVPDELHLWRIE